MYLAYKGTRYSYYRANIPSTHSGAAMEVKIPGMMFRKHQIHLEIYLIPSQEPTLSSVLIAE
jgi:hypothetical protein